MSVKKFKSCNKGYSCGASCISISYKCNKEYPEGVSIALDTKKQFIQEKINKGRKTISTDKLKDLLPDAEVKVVQNGNMVIITQNLKSSKKKEIQMAISKEIDPDSGKEIHSVGFMVNKDFNINKRMSRKAKLESARELNNMFNQYLKTVPEGDLATFYAYSGDGNENYRARAFRKKGFSIVDVEGSLQGGARMNKDGKLEPYPDFVLNKAKRNGDEAYEVI